MLDAASMAEIEDIIHTYYCNKDQNTDATSALQKLYVMIKAPCGGNIGLVLSEQ